MHPKPRLTVQKFSALASLALIVLAAAAVVSSLSVAHNVRLLTKTWQDFDVGPAAKTAVLTNLQGIAGYRSAMQLGVDQNPDPSRLAALRPALVGATQAIADYESLGVTAEEQSALDVLHRTVSAEKTATDTAEMMIAAGKTTAEIENAVQIDDRPAVVALIHLADGLGLARTASREMVNTIGARAIAISTYSGGALSVLLIAVGWGFAWFGFGRRQPADDAGLGSQPLAGDVKTVAAQISRAMADIDGQLDLMRDASGEAAVAMTKIGGIIGKMNGIAALSARLEQLDTIGEMPQAPQRVEQGGDAGLDRAMGNLQSELNELLMAVGSKTDERRRYERVSGKGVRVMLQAQGRITEAALSDISRGGAAIASEWILPVGTMVEIDLPTIAGKVAARVVRSNGQEIGLTFAGDPVNLAHVDRALDALSSRSVVAANQ